MAREHSQVSELAEASVRPDFPIEVNRADYFKGPRGIGHVVSSVSEGFADCSHDLDVLEHVWTSNGWGAHMEQGQGVGSVVCAAHSDRQHLQYFTHL